MYTERLKAIEHEINQIKQALQTIGPMRSGSLTQQYREKGKGRAYWQLSYTHKMKGRTEYIRDGFARKIQAEIAEYKRFRELVERWVELGMEQSRLEMEQARENLQDGKSK